MTTQKMSPEEKTFEPGQLVRITDRLYRPDIPSGTIGLILSKRNALVINCYNVLINGQVVRIHKMWFAEVKPNVY